MKPSVFVKARKSPGPLLGAGTAEGAPLASIRTVTGRKYVSGFPNLTCEASGMIGSMRAARL